MKKSPLLVRMPLIIALLLGAWLWKGGLGLLPSDRELTWKLGGDYASIRKAELQVWEGETLLTREELSMPNGAMADPTQKLSLRSGSYTAKVFVWRKSEVVPRAWSSTFVVADGVNVIVSR
jgi:hypothetical protein